MHPSKWKYLRIALFWSAIFLQIENGSAQNGKLVLLPGAEKLSYDEQTGLQRLVGNLSFTYQGHTMFCDSAHFNDRTNEVWAYGGVHLNRQDVFNLFCDSLYYNGKTRKAKLWGNVRVRDQEYLIRTDTLEYDAKKELAIYRHGGRIENTLSRERLTSRVGYMYPNSKNLFFSGKVSYRNEELTMTSDTLQYRYQQKRAYFYGPTTIVTKDTRIECEKGWYHTETEEGSIQKNARVWKGPQYLQGDSLYVKPKIGFAEGRGNVIFRDSTQPYEFQGNRFWKDDRIGKSYLTNRALCVYRLKNDTLHIHADTLFTFSDSLQQMKSFVGRRSVRFFSTNVQSACDTLLYWKDSSRMELRQDPVLWSRNGELKGTKMDIYLKDSVIDWVHIDQKATAVMELDSGNFYNQIGGREMRAFFRDNQVETVRVDGNAQTIFYPEETSESDTLVEIKRSGMSRVYASSLRIFLDSGEVERILYVEKPDAIFYPIDQINQQEKFVQGFSWNPARRPRSVAALFE